MNNYTLLSREDLLEMVDRITEKAIARTFQELGIKPRDLNRKMSFSKACRFVGSRAKVEEAMRTGVVAFSKRNPDKVNSTIEIPIKDLMKLI